MQIKALGVLKPHAQLTSWYESEKISIPFLQGEKIAFSLDYEEEEAPLSDFEQAIDNFLALTQTLKKDVEPYIYKNYLDFKNAVEPEDCVTEITEPAHVWQHIEPTDINVSRRGYGNHDVYVRILCECDWEDEHGLQIVFHKGKTLNRVSDQDGHLTHCDAFGLPEEKDKIC